MHTVVIIGAGFGGIKTALELNRKRIHDLRIILISDKPHFEYHARLYRVLTGRSPLEVCIPLETIFRHTFVELIIDPVVMINTKKREVITKNGQHIAYNTLVLAVGSVPGYYDIPGLKHYSFTASSIERVLALKDHLHEVFAACQRVSDTQKVCNAHIVVVGGGASGVEIAGELAVYLPQLAEKHGVDPAFITIDLVHSRSQILPTFPRSVSSVIAKRLRELGVNLLLNRRITQEEVAEVYMPDMKMKTKTVIWCAGTASHPLLNQFADGVRSKNGAVAVNTHLMTQDESDIYVIGDAASDPNGGMAQTALRQGDYVAQHIALQRANKPSKPYKSKKPVYAVPVGPGWAAYVSGALALTGSAGWFFRRYLDIRFFFSILSISQAISAYRHDRILWETCPVCCRNPDACKD